MLQQVEANWMVWAVVIIAVLLVARLLLRRGSRTLQRSYKPDVLDEGVGPAQRNQALIDAPPAAQVPPVMVAPPAGELLGGIAEAVSVAVQEEVAEAEEAPAAPEPEAEPAPEPAPEPEPAPAAPPAAADDLSRIKGLGPKLKVILEGLGVNSFAQIAAWTDDDLARIDPQLGAFAGRPARDNWVEQAKLLSAGDIASYEAKFGKI